MPNQFLRPRVRDHLAMQQAQLKAMIELALESVGIDPNAGYQINLATGEIIPPPQANGQATAIVEAAKEA